MGKIRVTTLGDEEAEKKQAEKAKARREGKKAEKAHTKGVGLKGGQQLKEIAGDELKPEVAAMLQSGEIGTEGAGEGEVKEKKAKKKKKIRIRSKRYQALVGMVDKNKLYNAKDAVKLVKKTSTTTFDGTVEAHININPAIIDKDKPTIAGSVNLPHGTGKKRVVEIATDELIKKVSEGKIEFDVLVAHPSMMSKLAKVARILGPKGLMPNPKTRTVTPEPEKRVKELSGGEVNYKTEPNNPIIHQAIGKVSFKEEQLAENLKTMVKAVGANKIAKLTLSSTMGPGIRVDLGTV